MIRFESLFIYGYKDKNLRYSLLFYLLRKIILVSFLGGVINLVVMVLGLNKGFKKFFFMEYILYVVRMYLVILLVFMLLLY